MVSHLSDDEIRNLSRGGHDYRKVYAAFKAATEHVGQPTVILAHTIKGWTLGPDFEARNATHQMKKLTVAELKEFRDRLCLEIPDSALEAELPRTTTRARTPTRSPTCGSAARHWADTARWSSGHSRWSCQATPAKRTPRRLLASSRSPRRWRSSGCGT
jgi:pyruvate dehydrogenase complex dehydrogenase (E1) component